MAEYTPAQDGHGSIGAWTDAAGDFFQTGGLNVAGIRFDLPVEMATGLDVILDPPVFRSLTLTLTTHLAIANPFRYSLYFMDAQDPPAFSLAYNPWDLVGGGETLRMVFSVLHAPMLAGEELEIDCDMSLLTPMYRKSTWQGRYSVLFTASDTVVPLAPLSWRSRLSATPTVLDGDNVGFISGMVGMNPRAKSRGGRCERCGEFMLRERLMKDGWTPGLWVCEECWDEEEPPDRPIPPDRPPIND